MKDVQNEGLKETLMFYRDNPFYYKDNLIVVLGQDPSNDVYFTMINEDINECNVILYK